MAWAHVPLHPQAIPLGIPLFIIFKSIKEFQALLVGGAGEAQGGQREKGGKFNGGSAPHIHPQLWVLPVPITASIPSHPHPNPLHSSPIPIPIPPLSPLLFQPLSHHIPVSIPSPKTGAGRWDSGVY